jgi:hypothetical protein
MMEAVQTFETLVYSYRSTRHYNPEDSHLQSHRHENFKSYRNLCLSLLWKTKFHTHRFIKEARMRQGNVLHISKVGIRRSLTFSAQEEPLAHFE